MSTVKVYFVFKLITTIYRFLLKKNQRSDKSSKKKHLRGPKQILFNLSFRMGKEKIKKSHKVHAMSTKYVQINEPNVSIGLN